MEVTSSRKLLIIMCHYNRSAPLRHLNVWFESAYHLNVRFESACLWLLCYVLCAPQRQSSALFMFG